MDRKIHVHFMGIGGSGMAPIALIAKSMGFEVSGCDVNSEGYYYDKLRESNIEVTIGHDASHLENIDILTVTPAIFDLNPNNPEIVLAKEKGILMTWQEFMGKYIQAGKDVITIAGTHGKSTTTVLMGVVLETADLDPYVEAGTIYKPWGSGARVGSNNYFVCEADEFNNNYHHYSPKIAIINNIEMDHPEFFKDFGEVKSSFKKHILSLNGPKILVINEESQGIREVLEEAKEEILQSGIKVIGYYMDNQFDFPYYKEYQGKLLECENDKTIFELYFENEIEKFELALKGVHNVMNALGVITASKELGVETFAIQEALKNFDGISRRSQLVEQIGDIMIFDDYAHHPTAVDAIIKAFKQNYKNRRVITVIEPHQISRVNMFHKEFADALKNSDYAVITKVFVGREKGKNLELMNMYDIISDIGTYKAKYIEDFDEVAKYIKHIAKDGDVILVLGAGESYKLTKKIIAALKEA